MTRKLVPTALVAVSLAATGVAAHDQPRAHHDQSTKSGGKWRGDLPRTLVAKRLFHAYGSA